VVVDCRIFKCLYFDMDVFNHQDVYTTDPRQSLHFQSAIVRICLACVEIRFIIPREMRPKGTFMVLRSFSWINLVSQ